MAEVGTVMEKLIRDFQVPDAILLRQGNYNEVAKLWADRGLILKATAAEIENDDHDSHEEAMYVLNELRKMALASTPCIRGLMAEASSGKITAKHGEMIDCAVSYYQDLRTILGTACVEFAPDSWGIYDIKFN